MVKRSADQFQTIRTEGAILPPDILQLIAAEKVEGASPEAYHLPAGTRLNEAISRSWTALLAHWRAFREVRQRIPEREETGTSVTNEKWLLPLFQELGYGWLKTTKAPEIDGRVYPIERFYNRTPIHLIGCRLPLDRRTKGARGAATASPHSMVQEFLNRTEGCLWGILSNGLQLRVLRDNVSLSRQAYVEFDLQAMMDGEVYPDFALLWMVCHQSRVEADKPQDFWLEKWSSLAREHGTRVLAHLRDGVAQAIEALGAGFIAYPRNDHLRQKLQSGALDAREYYRQILRIVYRLLFLFVAEDRELLHPPDADSAACELYDTHYSTRRLRELAHRIRGSKHTDLWHALSLVFDALGSPEGCPELALPALGSFLWRRSSTPDLLGPSSKQAEPVAEPVLITNEHLLAAIRALAYVEQNRVLRAVDYRNLGSEELGSVYESLLELHPVMNIAGKSFSLSIAAGHERKTTGSYYTPDSLVQCLLDSALEPVVEDRLEEAKRMANGQWRMVQGVFRERFIRYAAQRLPGSGVLETGHGDRKAALQADENVSKARTVRTDKPDAQSGSIDSVESGGRMGPSGKQGISAVHSSRPGESQGVGDSTHPQPRGRTDHQGESAADPERDRHTGPTTDRPDPLSEREEQLADLFSQTPFPIRHSLFAEQALLALKICDPACGSGHFLIAAAHRLARHLARVRTGESEPSPAEYQHALRDIIGRCIYGVDLNPMAVELCKVNLWMEALEPGKPLSFLDHHIQCGNSLLGTTPALLAQGIPDDAFKPIQGDDKKFCSDLKKENKRERAEYERGQGYLFAPLFKLGNLPQTVAQINTASDDSLADITAKQEMYERMVKGADYRNARLLADTWCAVFVWQKDKSDLGELCPTERTFRRIEENPHSILPQVKAEVQRLAGRYQFFHWHLAFPDVFRLPAEGETAENEHTGWNGGFDCVLGNPPWERIKLQEKEWFAERVPEIANAPNAAARRRMIAQLQEAEPGLYSAFLSDRRRAEGQSHLVRDSGRYPLCGRGDVNTYTIFA
ncbi:MAG TPA: hypothetical protein EYH34_18540, partial [Planctomycetes bacterium]|nr:hypothetical protein [Planctomycetota bacterium]